MTLNFFICVALLTVAAGLHLVSKDHVDRNEASQKICDEYFNCTGNISDHYVPPDKQCGIYRQYSTCLDQEDGKCWLLSQDDRDYVRQTWKSNCECTDFNNCQDKVSNLTSFSGLCDFEKGILECMKEDTSGCIFANEFSQKYTAKLAARFCSTFKNTTHTEKD